MPVEALLLPLRMPLFCSFEIIALVGCGIRSIFFITKGMLESIPFGYLVVSMEQSIMSVPTAETITPTKSVIFGVAVSRSRPPM